MIEGSEFLYGLNCGFNSVLILISILVCVGVGVMCGGCVMWCVIV